MNQTKIVAQNQKQRPIGSYPRHMRLAIAQGAAACRQAHHGNVAGFFPLRFLLQRGLPIIIRHLLNSTFSDAIDLTLTWAEEWPAMHADERQARVKALTPIASDLLQRIDKLLIVPHIADVELSDAAWAEGTPPLVNAFLPN